MSTENHHNCQDSLFSLGSTLILKFAYISQHQIPFKAELIDKTWSEILPF